VLAATLAELAEIGYPELSVENVAQRAGVHKTTIYRRWRDREALVIDAVAENVITEVPVPDTGSIEGDMRALARGLVRWLHSPIGKGVLATMCPGAACALEVEEGRREFYRIRFGQVVPVIERAISRGELPADTDPTEVIKTMAAPIYFRMLVLPEPVDDAVADRAVDIALAAARAGALRRREQPGAPGKR
jgi:AcrR family transcriptional regulator